MPKHHYSENVFINCPFDSEYQPLLHALLFAVFDCGYVPRCALEVDDGVQVRIDKILQIVGDCRFGIHDISRTSPDPQTGLPRFNMPLELGMFVGAKRFGAGRQKQKVGLVMDKERYRYQSFISDIAGQDIKAHGANPQSAVRIVRDWLRCASGSRTIPGGKAIWERYRQFQADLPKLLEEIRVDRSEITYVDYTNLVSEWLKVNG